MKPRPFNIATYIAFTFSILFLGLSIFLYSRTLFLKSTLDDVRFEYENLLSEKLQLERSYYKLKEDRMSEPTSGFNHITADRFNDSLAALKKHQEEEVARLYRKIEELHQQIIISQKNKSKH